MQLKKISTNSDLSESSLLSAIAHTYEEKVTLYCSVALLKIAQKLAEKIKIPYGIDDELPSDAWYVKGKYRGIFSPGA